MSGSVHDCPIEACQIDVPDQHLLCPVHWAMVPAGLRRAVYAAWNKGKGRGTYEHAEACQAAISFVNGKLREDAR
jgi:hypothetical protein